LTEIGFTPDERHLLLVSHSGRGLIELETGLLVARDADEPRSDSAWLNEPLRRAVGIGPADGVPINVVGLWGGHLPQATADGWRILVERTSRDEKILLAHSAGGPRWVPDRPDRPTTEVRAAGFSSTGRFFVIATASDVAIFARRT
jgi:hypothetical protein